MNVYKPVTFTALSGALIFLLLPSLSESRKTYDYIGMERCRPCHGQEALGNQFAVWQSSPHSRAYRRLKTEKAGKIAKKHGIEEPSTDRSCLKCHNTGGGRVESLIGEGVGCEACHGPAEGYIEPEVHIGSINREAAYQRAITRGMYPILGIDHIKNREKLCRHCHNRERLCYPESIAEIRRQRISLQVIIEMKKGDLSLSHKVRR
jgi:hypothetical protein